LNNKKLETITNLFDGNEIRSVWDSDMEDYYFSVVDVVSVLSNSPRARKYWNALKTKLIDEGSELSRKVGRLKLKARDGKFRDTDVLDTEGILRLIESIPSPNAEPFKMWLARLGKERIDEVFDPEVAINRAVDYYRKKGYSDEWIEYRLKGIVNRKKLTDVWQQAGITEDYEYAMLTNQIYKVWSGMTAGEYKEFKGIRKESLRDNMTDIEVILTDLGEITTRDIARNENPVGLKENMAVAKRGGKVSKLAKDYYEEETNRKVVADKNALGSRYDNQKMLAKNIKK